MHTVEMPGRKVVLENITSVSRLSQLSDKGYIFLVQNEDTIDIWEVKDGRYHEGITDILNYYKELFGWNLDPNDFIVMREKDFYI